MMEGARIVERGVVVNVEALLECSALAEAPGLAFVGVMVAWWLERASIEGISKSGGKTDVPTGVISIELALATCAIDDPGHVLLLTAIRCR